ncbi:Uncharacterised protein [Chlamydia trachomatis]|nr:Uncharacterised protein [Chlamydia trachomatis]
MFVEEDVLYPELESFQEVGSLMKIVPEMRKSRFLLNEERYDVL